VPRNTAPLGGVTAGKLADGSHRARKNTPTSPAVTPAGFDTDLDVRS
jgi:hypothetical protein